MRIWLITVGEPLPIDGRGDRLLRTGMLASFLAARGHEVLWWASTFDHIRRAQRFPTDTTVSLRDGSRIRLLRSVGYRRTVSIRRIVEHGGVARKFARQAEYEPAPDVVLCSLPTNELALAATRYGRRHRVPVVLDIRDLWPDLLLDHAPRWGRWPARVLLAPMFRWAREACSGATAIIGVTPGYVEWALDNASRLRSALDQDFPFGYERTAPAPEAMAAA